jgi:hypothetical protein
MADEAFALSPISARAELPSEADYDAIREAFLETARGRWFLGEFGKRNRNADTTMVLDAVARIEATIVAQKQVPTNELPDALVLIRGLLSDAKDNAAKTMSGPDAEEALAAVNKATRIVREIAWTLREYGTDARICDMLDTQVNAVDSNHQRTIATDKRDAILATFDLLIRRIGELGGSGGAVPSRDSETAASPSSFPLDHAPAAVAETEQAATAPFEIASESAAEAVVEVAAMPDEIGNMARDRPAHDAPEATPPSSETSAAAMMAASAEVAPADSPEDEVVAATDAETAAFDFETAQDMAVLDAIALEMAEPEIAESEIAESSLVESNPVESNPVESSHVDSDLAEPARFVEPDLVEPGSAEPGTVEPDSGERDSVQPGAGESVGAEPGTVETSSVEPAIIEQVPETAIAPAQEPEPEMPSEPSLGATLIASGIVSSRSSTNDALAPIRRMTQAERIAFFS